jgi:hypothetical protein
MPHAAGVPQAAQQIPRLLVVSAFGQSAVKQSILTFMEQWEEAERSLSDDDVKQIVFLQPFVAVATRRNAT